MVSSGSEVFIYGVGRDIERTLQIYQALGCDTMSVVQDLEQNEAQMDRFVNLHIFPYG